MKVDLLGASPVLRAMATFEAAIDSAVLYRGLFFDTRDKLFAEEEKNHKLRAEIATLRARIRVLDKIDDL